MRLDLKKLTWVVRMAQEHRETGSSDEAADLAVDHVNRWLEHKERLASKRRKRAKSVCPNCGLNHKSRGCIDTSSP